MPSIAGKYQHYKNEDIDDYFSAVGVPYMGRKMMSMSSPVMEITLDGETMTIKNSSLLRTTEYKFKLGEEYVENMPNTSIKSVTILVNDHEIQTNSVIPENGAKCGRHYLFTDEECIIQAERLGYVFIGTIRCGILACMLCVVKCLTLFNEIYYADT